MARIKNKLLVSSQESSYRDKNKGKTMISKTMGVIMLLIALSTLSGCQSTHTPNTTLLLKDGKVIERTLMPSTTQRLTINFPENGEKVKDNTNSKKTSPINAQETQRGQDQVRRQKYPQQQLINFGGNRNYGSGGLQVYTEIPVPMAYSPARVIVSGNQNILIPATPTKIQRVKVGPNSRIQGFVDYGPTINVPVRTPRGTRYIQQRSPMPMPIIETFSVTYE